MILKDGSFGLCWQYCYPHLQCPSFNTFHVQPYQIARVKQSKHSLYLLTYLCINNFKEGWIYLLLSKDFGFWTKSQFNCFVLVSAVPKHSVETPGSGRSEVILRLGRWRLTWKMWFFNELSLNLIPGIDKSWCDLLFWWKY